MKNVITRTITGLLYVAIVVGAILAGNLWFWGLTALFAIAAVNEFNRITNNNFVSYTTGQLDILGALLLVSTPFAVTYNFMAWSLLAYALYLIIRFIVQLYMQDGNPLAHLAHSILGQVYIALPLSILNMLYICFGNHMVLSMFILIWLSDTGAFCVGSLIGKHKLFERISPKKSWEGFVGGLAFCLLASIAFHFGIPSKFPFSGLPAMLGFGIVVCVFGTWGDLVESLIKRSLGVKDSGKLLPGHGGILDRVDSLLLVVPAVAVYTVFTNII